MKKILWLSIILAISFNLSSQDFAPIGAEWHYTEKFVFSGNINYLKISSIEDTLIQGKNCKKLLKEEILECSTRPHIEYVYSEDSVIYYWDNDFNEFQKLYDFKTQTENWIIKIKDWDNDIDSLLIVVDSTSYTTINEIQLKVLHVTYYGIYDDPLLNFYYNSEIVEKIGDLSYLFNLFPESYLTCDLNYSEGLRCYEDSDFGFYSTGIADSCTYTYDWINIDKNRSKESINIFPNPTTGQMQIKIDSDKPILLEVFDIRGNSIYSTEFESEIQIDLTDQPNGVYILKLKSYDLIIREKKIIKY